MAVYDEFINLAAAGSHDRAVQWLYLRTQRVAFDACFALAVSHGDAYKKLWDAIPMGERSQDLVLDLVYQGFMPQRPYGQVDENDYDAIREVFLKSYDKTKLPSWWPSRLITCKSVCLYPEYARRRYSLRQAIVELALRNSRGGPADPRQANLFALGGRYTWSRAKQGTHPGGPSGHGTSCMLVARSILHAAGVNVIGPHTKNSCSVDDGLNAELAHLNCYIKVKKGAAMPAPAPGDIFHISGKDFGKPGATYGSDHVGIIVSVSGNHWTCVQGGGGDHVTATKDYTVVDAGDHTWGDWRFQEDTAVHMIRGLKGFWNPDYIGSGDRMRGG